MIEVRHLRLLVAVDRTGSLSGAARALSLTQPAVSQQIRALERALRVPLLVRKGRGSELTEAGRTLLRHANDVLTSLSLAESEVTALAGLRSGRVRLVSFPSAAATIVPPAMTEMSTTYPGVKLTLTEAEPPEALDLLRRGECDIAIVFRYASEGDGHSSGIVHVPLLTEDMHLALPVDHPAAHGGRVDLSMMRYDRWIAGCPRCRAHLLDLCAEVGFIPDVAFTTDDYVTLQCLAAHGFGAALISDLMLAVVSVEGLCLREFQPSAQRVISAISTRGLSQVPAVRQTLSALTAAGHQLQRPAEPHKPNADHP